MLDARPPLDEWELEAVRAVLERVHRGHPAYDSVWRRTAAEESVCAPADAPDDEAYALSPRSTRGATRA